MIEPQCQLVAVYKQKTHSPKPGTLHGFFIGLKQMGVGYNCETCQLYFYLGSHISWNLEGCSQSRVCRCCGTMHSIRHLKNGADAVFAQSSPIMFDLINGDEESLLKTMNEPSMIRSLPTSVETQSETVLPRRMDAIKFDELVCNHCDGVGTLELEWNVDNELRNGMCPKCERSDIVAVFADSC